MDSSPANRESFAAVGTEVELEVDSLAYEGAGVGRVDGQVFFVSGAAPGDRVRARITRRRKRLAEAHVIEVLEPGPARIAPPCPVADRCGGCDWQHVAYETQTGAKRQILVDAFERSAKIPNPPVAAVTPSPDAYGYRNRIRLHVEAKQLCYYERNSRRAVVVTDCLIADERVRAAMPSIRTLIENLDLTVLEVEIASRGELPGVVASLACRGRLRGDDSRKIPKYLATPGQPVVGVTLHGPHWHRVWGDFRRRFLVGDPELAIDCIDTAFGQINTRANRFLIDQVLSVASLTGKEQIWDLYAGAGNLSLPLARTAGHVISVERDPGAVAAGKSAAAEHGIANVHFQATDVENWLLTASNSPDLAVVNPPRSGLGPLATHLAAKGARRLIYVSCNPATLARDLVVLGERGYRLEQVRPIDLFPQTCRVEAVCELVLT